MFHRLAPFGLLSPAKSTGSPAAATLPLARPLAKVAIGSAQCSGTLLHAVPQASTTIRIIHARPHARPMAAGDGAARPAAGRHGGPGARTSKPRRQGTSLLIRVDQLPRGARTPGPWLAPPQVPSRLSPVPPTKNG